MSKRNGTYVIRRKEQLAAAASPARQEILDALAAAGPSSAAELAQRMGRPADSLYHHLRLLVRVGLVVEHSRRRTTYRTEVIYAPAGLARRFKAHIDLGSREVIKSWERAIGAMLRLGIGDFRRALRSQTIVTQGRCRNLWGARIKAYLSAAELGHVNRLMDELFRLLSNARPAPRAKLYAITCLLVPCRPTTRVRKPSRAHASKRLRRADSVPSHGVKRNLEG